ncbi:MAG: YgiQ family radical SAM protein [Spirochaetaceae bacterium]|nr:MAG: YgiQ family radical SAM protein [Spirochaetaceae bacterium]
MQNLSDYRADRSHFLPTHSEDLSRCGLAPGDLDFIFVSGDAYVDHPSFGPALLGRMLESHGYRVGIIAQPSWGSPQDFARLGRPRLAFLVSAGNMDSMVANYTVAGKPRRDDAYSPGGEGGRRPDRATLVYCTRIREAFKGVDIVVGGIEASLRRFAHYDFWANKMRRSILVDSKADLLVYGMGERAMLEIAAELSRGRRAADLTEIAGTVYKCRAEDAPGAGANGSANPPGATGANGPAGSLGATGGPRKTGAARKTVSLPDWDTLQDKARGKRAYAESFREQHRNTDGLNADILVEAYGPWVVVQNPPQPTLFGDELDHLYELPYTRTFHPDYLELGGVPAVEEVRFSLVSARGCFGGCSFCALTFHQGRRIGARSKESLLREARLLTQLPGFKGYIHDVGGPTANFRAPACEHQGKHGVCKDKQCLFPDACKQLKVDHTDYRDVLRALRQLPGIKKVFVRSGIRFDYLLLDSDQSFLRELCTHHVSGKLKVAPEHITPQALSAMGKPGMKVYEKFRRAFEKVNTEIGSKQFIVPYFISSHPGTTLRDAVALAEYFRDQGGTPEQVQDFYPTPGTVATCMYYTGIDPRNGKTVAVTTEYAEKAMQRALLQFRDPKNYRRVREALEQTGRTDLIGTGPKCLIRPYPPRTPGRDARSGGKPAKATKPGPGPGGKPAKHPASKSGKPRQKRSGRSY